MVLQGSPCWAWSQRPSRALLQKALDCVSVRQLQARPFSIIKLDFGTIHRSVANTGGFERIMFWISFSRCVDLLPLEPMVQVVR